MLPDPLVLLAIGAAVLVGSIVQGTVGFGVGLVAAPIIALLAPELIPTVILILGFGLGVFMTIRTWRDINWPGFWWSIIGRLPGTTSGALLLAVLAPNDIKLAVGVIVLVAVGLSFVRWKFKATALSVTIAGFFSGLMGTSAGIGGPPMGIVYQNNSGPEVRATLSAMFSVGSLISMGAVTLAGKFTQPGILTGLLLLPVALIGYRLARPIRIRVDAKAFRYTILAISAASAIILIVWALVASA